MPAGALQRMRVEGIGEACAAPWTEAFARLLNSGTINLAQSVARRLNGVSRHRDQLGGGMDEALDFGQRLATERPAHRAI